MILADVIQRSPLVVHKMRSAYDVEIGRPTKWGNPFTHQAFARRGSMVLVADRGEAIRRYAQWLSAQDHLLAAIPELRGKRLGCWCDPHTGDFNPLMHACHGHVLAWLANR